MCSVNLCVREGPLEIVYVANFEVLLAQVQYFGLFMAWIVQWFTQEISSQEEIYG
jgi:hypothetical protein